MSDFHLINRIPTPQEFNYLRTSVNWPVIDEKILYVALDSTIYSACAQKENKTVGFGRIIGDGAMYFYIQDVIVHPNFQGKGIGFAIVRELIQFWEESASIGSFLGLMSAKGKERFYRKFGFVDRPNEEYGAGMCIYKNATRMKDSE